MKDLLAQPFECKEELRVLKKSRNNHIRKYQEERIRWARERNHDRAKANELLQFEKIEYRHSEEELEKTRVKLRDASFKLLMAEETDRKQIAREIDDGIGQHWSTVKLRVERVLNQVGKGIATPLEEIPPAINVGIEETPQILMNLRPALLDDLGTLATLNWFCREFQNAPPAIRVETKVLATENDTPSARRDSLQTFQKCGISLMMRTHSCASPPPQIRPSSNRTIMIRRTNPIPPLG
jgi:signal transduction histidine kinase